MMPYAPPPPPIMTSDLPEHDTAILSDHDRKFLSLPSSTIRDLPSFGNLSEKAVDMISENLRGEEAR